MSHVVRLDSDPKQRLASSLCHMPTPPTKFPSVIPRIHSSSPTTIMADPNDQYSFSSDGESEDALNPEAEALLDRSTILLTEIESFQKSLRRAGHERTVELRLFLNQVKSEHRCLQGVSIPEPTAHMMLNLRHPQ
jgi:hypothetical protein